MSAPFRSLYTEPEAARDRGQGDGSKVLSHAADIDCCGSDIAFGNAMALEARLHMCEAGDIVADAACC